MKKQLNPLEMLKKLNAIYAGTDPSLKASRDKPTKAKNPMKAKLHLIGKAA